jgi:hypothetical protein
MNNIKIEILVKFQNEIYEDFEFKVNKRLSLYTLDIEVLSVDFLYDNKNVIAIIKYNTLSL